MKALSFGLVVVISSAAMAAVDMIDISMNPQNPGVTYAGWTSQELACAAPKETGRIEFNAGQRSYGVAITIWVDDAHRGTLTFRLNGEPLGEFDAGPARAGLIPAFFFAEAGRMRAGKNTLEVRTDRDREALAIQAVRLVPLADKVSPRAAGLRLSDWHAYATRYIQAPTFRCDPIEGAAEYHVRLQSQTGREATAASKTPTISLENAWNDVAPGKVVGTMTALDASGTILAANVVVFHKVRPFEGGVAPYRQSPADTVDGVADFLVNVRSPKAYTPDRSPLLWHATITTDGTVSPMGYPTHNAYHIEFFLEYAKWTHHKVLAQRGIALARELADWNVQHRTPADWKYPGVFYTTVVDGKMGGNADADTLIVTLTGLMGRSLLRLGIAEKEPKYVLAAIDTARCLLATQYPEGNWPFRVEPKSGKVANPYTSSVILPVLFFDELMAAPPELAPGVKMPELREKLKASRTRAMAWIVANPLKDYRWEGFCEDVSNLPPYVATEWYDAGWTAKYLIEHRSEFPDQFDAALRLVAWIEDQFVCWHAGDVPRMESRIPIIPAVLEQYRCYTPVDCCNAWLLDVYLAAQKATGDETYLQKAKALASALTQARRPSGAIATWSYYNNPKDAQNDKPADLGDWFSCMVYDAHMLMRHEKTLR